MSPDLDDSSTCRTCLKDNIPRISAFSSILDDQESTKICDMLYEVTSIRITETDSINQSIMPNGLCENCVVSIRDSYEFKQKCLESEKRLVQRLTAIVSCESEIKPDIGKSELIPYDSSDWVSQAEPLLGDVSNETEPTEIVVIKDPLECSIDAKKLTPVDRVNIKKSNALTIKGESDDDVTIIDYKPPPALVYPCTKCGKRFRRESELRQHLLKCHRLNQSNIPKNNLPDVKKPSYHCRRCNVTFIFKNNYIMHLRTHLPRKCEKCDESFLSEKCLLNHQKKKHTPEVRVKPKDCHLCPTCGKSFTEGGNLNAHMRIHSGEKPYVCEICNKAFTQWASLKHHKSIHNDARNYVCATCGNAYKRRNALLAHARKHTGERKFACSVCDKKFFTSTCLKDHFTMHTNEKNHICSFCNKGFNRKKTLVVHLRSHTGERPYSCDICGRAFMQRVVLRTHMKVHGPPQKDKTNK